MALGLSREKDIQYAQASWIWISSNSKFERYFFFPFFFLLEENHFTFIWRYIKQRVQGKQNVICQQSGKHHGPAIDVMFQSESPCKNYCDHPKGLSCQNSHRDHTAATAGCTFCENAQECGP